MRGCQSVTETKRTTYFCASVCPSSSTADRLTEMKADGFSVQQLAMRDHESCNSLLVLLLVYRRGNNERVEGLKIRIGCKRCTIAQHCLVPAFANVRCCPFGYFARLTFGGSIND